MTTTGATAPLWSPGFVRLLSTRLLSQAGDGCFAAGVAFLVLLAPDAQRTPGAYVGALALLLLPFCVVGPFAACVLDRWRRRQVLVAGQLVRGVLALALVPAAVAVRSPWWVYALVLLALGVNRLLLAALSAAVPHVVRGPRFIDANALAPTAGTVATGIGTAGGTALAVLTALGGAGPLVLAVVLWLAAALVVRGFGAAALGPDRDVVPPTPGDAVRDLLAAVRHVAGTPAAAALLRFGLLRLVLGGWTLAALATVGLRDGDAAVVAGLTAVGFGLGALATPLASRLVGTVPWLWVATGGTVLVGALAPLAATPWSWALAGAALGVLAQSLKIWTDTVVQRSVDEVVLGRAFTVYDLAYNVPFVLGALLVVPLV